MSGMRERATTALLLPASLALLLAIGIAALAHRETRLQRLVNANLDAGAIPDTYLVPSDSKPGYCRVAGRRGATIHRNETGAAGRNWTCQRFGSESPGLGPDLWLVRAKRKGTGTVLFVPVEQVPDWGYPYLYEFVRLRLSSAELPAVHWTQLFVSRIYQGLYLRVPLPFDLRKREGGSGVRRELLTLRDGEVSVVDTRFLDAGALYDSRLEAGAAPELPLPSQDMGWLVDLRPTPGLTLLLSNLEPFELSPLPLPVSLPDLYARIYRRAPVRFRDPGLARSLPDRGTSTRPPLLSAEEFADLRSGFESYAGALQSALSSHRHLYDQSETTLDRLAERLDSLLKQSLAPGGI